MRIYVPEIGKKVNLSAKEKRTLKQRLFDFGHGCFPEPPIMGGFVNQKKHIARMKAEEEKIVLEKKRKEAAEAAEKERKTPAALRLRLENGEKLTVEEYLVAVYDVEAHVMSLAMTHLSRLKDLFGNCTGCLEGKKVLDIACGSRTSYTDFGIFSKKGNLEPWLCRALHKCGARAIGMDIGNNDGEPFEHHWADLTEKGTLGRLFGQTHDSSFDAIVVSMFIGELSPILQMMTNEAKRSEMKNEIFAEAVRLLKEGGWFLYEFDAYRKANGKLVADGTPKY